MKKAKKATPKRQVSASRAVVHRANVRARYDLAQTTDENRRHFASVDGLSADAATSPEIRRVLRNRCRYEVANNSYAKGIGATIANDTIGSGPQLQVLTGDKAQNTLWETAFWKWASEIRLAEKLRLMRFARYDSGECFAVFVTNPRLKSPVKLDIQLIEADQIADPTYSAVSDESVYDGITYDEFGNPRTYRKLKAHPGSMNWMTLPTEYDDLPASQVFHYFKPDRPGQKRGIPDITPAAQLFAELRRYRAAVIAAAETAADFSAVLYSDAPPDPTDETNSDVQAMDTVELTRRMATTLPQGWKLGQIEACQPMANYPEFVATILKEIARCINVPFTVAAMDASVANMSAAYADRQPYAHERRLEREELESTFLNPLLEMWVREASMIPAFLPRTATEIKHAWFWNSLGHHADPQKVANAISTELASGMTTLPLEHSKRGQDWEEQQESAAKSLGLTVAAYREKLIESIFGSAQKQQPIKDTNEDTNDSGKQASDDNGSPTSRTNGRSRYSGRSASN